METAVTRIVIDFVLSEPEIAAALRRAVSKQCCCLGLRDEILAAGHCVQQFVESQMEDSLLPAFAERILRSALVSECNWRFVGERLLCDPESN